jgi:hypothetical protein
MGIKFGLGFLKDILLFSIFLFRIFKKNYFACSITISGISLSTRGVENLWEASH